MMRRRMKRSWVRAWRKPLPPPPPPSSSARRDVGARPQSRMRMTRRRRRSSSSSLKARVRRWVACASPRGV